MADALQRIEAKLDQLLTAQAPAPRGQRPARTRRPPGEAEAPTVRRTRKKV